jgi:phosphate transport system permease protein
VLIIFAGLVASLGIGAWPAVKTFGPAFLTTQTWNPVTEHFGALASIYGTLVTSALAMVVAVPVRIGIAILLTELCPRPLRRPIESP